MEQQTAFELDMDLTDLAVAANETDPVTSKSNPTRESSALNLSPFAVIDDVSNNSPAQTAGLQVGDRILRFHTLTKGDLAHSLAPLANVVSQNEGTPISILVLRKNTVQNTVKADNEDAGLIEKKQTEESDGGLASLSGEELLRAAGVQIILPEGRKKLNDSQASNKMGKMASGSTNQASDATTSVEDRVVVNVTLTPQRWSGRGLLGCHLIPEK